MCEKDFQLALNWFVDNGLNEGEDFVIEEDDGLYVYGDGSSSGAVLIKDGDIISAAVGGESVNSSIGYAYMELTGCEGLAVGKEKEFLDEEVNQDNIRKFLENK